MCKGLEALDYFLETYKEFLKGKDTYCQITLTREQATEFIKEVDEVKQVRKELNALEILKKHFNFEFYYDGFMLLVSIQSKQDEGSWDCTASANLDNYKEEYNLLKEVLENVNN